MGLAKILMQLPAVRVMTQLPPEQAAPIALAMHDLHCQADEKARLAQSHQEHEEFKHWHMVSIFARNVLRAFRREKHRRDHAQLTDKLMAELGLGQNRITEYIGAQMFRAPAAAKSRCMVEVDYDAFAPFIEAGDLIEVDWTAYQVQLRINESGLYVVAVDGEFLAIRGFHRRGTYGFYVHEDGSLQPKTIQMQESFMPEGYDIVGRVVAVYKKAKLPNQDK